MPCGIPFRICWNPPTMESAILPPSLPASSSLSPMPWAAVPADFRAPLIGFIFCGNADSGLAFWFADVIAAPREPNAVDAPLLAVPRPVTALPRFFTPGAAWPRDLIFTPSAAAPVDAAFMSLPTFLADVPRVFSPLPLSVTLLIDAAVATDWVPRLLIESDVPLTIVPTPFRLWDDWPMFFSPVAVVSLFLPRFCRPCAAFLASVPMFLIPAAVPVPIPFSSVVADLASVLSFLNPVPALVASVPSFFSC